MAVILTQKRKSRASTIAVDATASKGTLLFTAFGSRDENAIHAACLANLPVTYLSMFFQSYSIDPQGGGVWFVEANYSPLQPKKPGDSSYSFDTTGKTEHMTVSRRTVSSGLVPTQENPAPNFHGAIGVQMDGSNGSVQGVDVIVPSFSFNETHYIPQALVTGMYKWLLFKLTATVNSQPFKGLAPGECLFLGAKGSVRGVEAWEVSFSFEGRANLKNIPVPGAEVVEGAPVKGHSLGFFAESSDVVEETEVLKEYIAENDEISPEGEDDVESPAPQIVQIPPRAGGVQPPTEPWTGDVVPFKAGHDYLWYLFGPKVQGTTGQKRFVNIPIAWYVEQVYFRADHNSLGLPP